MRIRAARFWIVVALAAGTAMAGAAVPVGAIRPLVHDVSRAVAVPAHVAATISPSRAPSGAAAHLRAAAEDGSLALTVLLVLGVPMWIRRGRAARTVVGASSCGGGCRAPPPGWL